ncbi:phage tail tube protein [uncultured Novosphingobium sp.]|uniref:phage tail tube protein n=1 Tax=uncultured Novosphingobium sp. TaxID=292277 RepID=UPI0025855EE4|nr:phage tail tube protein [uncultured Novosphingobium sp.]
MAETQEASLGYGGELWLKSGAALKELKQVKEFDVPSGGAREQVETTHLKSPNWRREYVSGFFEDSDFEVVLNSRPLSDTDTLLAAALADGEVRDFKAVLPEDGTPVAQVTGTARCIAYSRGRVTAEGVMEATATFRVVTIADIVAYAAPA